VSARRPLLIPFLVIFVVTIFLFFFVDFATVVRQLRRADGRYLLAACLALLLGLAAYSNRWRALLAHKPGWMATFHAGNVGHMFNILIPFRAGEPARVLVLSQNQGLSLAEVTASVVVELTIEGVMRLAALIGALALGVGLAPRLAVVGLLLLTLHISLIILVVRRQEWVLAHLPGYLARLPRLTEESARAGLTNLLNGLATVTSPRQVGMAVLWSITIWGSFSLFHYLILLALDLEILASHALVISLGALALAPPSAPTQPGVYHTVVIGSLALAGFNLNAVTSYAIILHALQMAWMIGLGSWGLSQTGFSLGRLMPGTGTAVTHSE
jgi:glycosyltransferase 2 family protein